MLAFLSFIVLGFRAGSPTRMIYDEPYYVPAARALLSGTPSNLNPEAPPMGKLMIAAGIRLFGDTPFGWRFFGVVCGALTVLGVYFWTYLLVWKNDLAITAASLTLLNNFTFIMSRTAMMDVYLVAFVVLAILAFTAALELQIAVNLRRVLMASSGLWLGLACASKWNGIDTLLVLLLVVSAMWLIPWTSCQTRSWRTRLSEIGVFYTYGSLGLVALATYCGTFLPLLHGLNQPMTVRSLVAQNLYIWRFHVSVPYNPAIVLPWYKWFFQTSPQRALSYLVGNVVVMWGGLLALVFCAYRFWRFADLRAGLVALLYVANVLQWVVTPCKGLLYYYYYPAATFLGVAIVVMLSRIRRSQVFGVRLCLLTVLAAGVFFVRCYPQMTHLEAPWDCALGCWT
jgi:4-amino-4-deoxy-L-arabinose transferase-like glycosyltransferase